MAVETEDMKTERKAVGARTILLTSWASVATALFLMALIGGAIYLTNLRERCDYDSSDTKELHVKDGDYREDIVLDNKQKTQLVVRKDEDGRIVLLSGSDYNRKIWAIYLAEADYCLLSHGNDMDWDVTWNVTQTEEIDHDKEIETHYEERDVKNQVTDLSLVPEMMRPFCKGKQIFWAKPTQDGERTKRGIKAACCCHSHGCGCWCCHHLSHEMSA